MSRKKNAVLYVIKELKENDTVFVKINTHF